MDTDLAATQPDPAATQLDPSSDEAERTVTAAELLTTAGSATQAEMIAICMESERARNMGHDAPGSPAPRTPEPSQDKMKRLLDEPNMSIAA